MIPCTWTGHLASTALLETRERAERERRLACALEHDGGHLPAVRARIVQHERQAAEYEAQVEEMEKGARA